MSGGGAISAHELPPQELDPILYGTMNPAPINEHAHTKARMGHVGSAAGKLINRVQDCHPALRADFRERWYGEASGVDQPKPIPKPGTYRIAMHHLQRNLHSRARTSNTANSGQGLWGSADQKMVNRVQNSHPVLRDDASYKHYIRHGGAPRGGWRPHPNTVGRTRGKQLDPKMLVPKGGHNWVLAKSAVRSVSALELHRPPPLSIPGAESHHPASAYPGSPGKNNKNNKKGSFVMVPPPMVPPRTAPVAAAPEEPEQAPNPMAIHARRELCMVKPGGRSPPLPPSLSTLTPVPTLSWNGTTGSHPVMPMSRQQGLWQEEYDMPGPARLHSPLSPGSGSNLTPGVGTSLVDRGGGRLLRPLVVTDDKFKTMDRDPNKRLRSPPVMMQPRAGGGGAAELRQRTKGDRIWLSGQSWTSFS